MPRSLDTARKVAHLLHDAFKHWLSHRAPRLGAALSYYTIFSLAPLIVIVTSLVSLFVSKATVENALFGQLGSLLGTDGQAFLLSLITNMEHPSRGVIALVVGFVILIFGAMGVLSELKSSLDDFFEIPRGEQKKKGFFTFVRERLLTLAMIPVLMFLLLVSLVFSALVHILSSYLGSFMDATFLVNLLNVFFSITVVTLLFAFIYRSIPQVRLPWKEVLSGALATSILFAVGKLLIELYISKASGVTAYGAASTIIIIMIWVYYSIEIFLLGASVTYMYSKHYGYLKQKYAS